MKIALLIGASGSTKEGPTVPLGSGKFKLVCQSLKDSVFDVVYDNGMRRKLVPDMIIEGPSNIKLQMLRPGTERNEICVYALQEGD